MPPERRKHRDNVPAARELRARQTPVEVILWDALPDRRLAGMKFRRQHPIGPFVADFCCPDRRLIVELDGAILTTQPNHDAERAALLETAGYRILRFPNAAVRSNLSGVLDDIRATADAEPSRLAFPTPRTAGW